MKLALAAAILLQLGAALPALAQAQIQPFPGQPEPGRNIPAPAPPALPQFEFSIPAPQRGPVPRAVDQIEFDVSDIQISGSTVFPPEAFQPLTAPLIGHKAKLSNIIGVADQIEAMYRAHGYVLTRAFVPPQTVSNGVFKINVVEGFVKAAAVTGGDESSRQRVEAYIDPVTHEKPATLGSMERGLLLSNDLPGVAASGLLRPSPTEPGASDLLVNLTQVPWDVTAYSDNRGSASTGAVTLGFQGVANELYFIPGQFTFDASGTPDFSERRLFQGRYARPVGLSGAILTITGVSAHGVPASGSLVSDSYAVGGTLSYPLVVSRPTRITIDGGLNIQSELVTQTGSAASSSMALGESTTSNDDHWRDLSIDATMQQRDLLNGSNTGATIGVTQGIPWFGAKSTTPNADQANAFAIAGAAQPGGASTGFTKYTLVAQHDQPIEGPVSANFHALGQYSGERLVVGEQTSFGGSGIGRGYDPASLAADMGIGVSSELRYDTHFPRYYIDTAQFYTFFDAAKVRDHDENTPLPASVVSAHRSLLSTGVGVRVVLLQAVTGGIEFARELRGVANNDNGHLDNRILFNAAVRY